MIPFKRAGESEKEEEGDRRFFGHESRLRRAFWRKKSAGGAHQPSPCPKYRGERTRGDSFSRKGLSHSPHTLSSLLSPLISLSLARGKISAVTLGKTAAAVTLISSLLLSRHFADSDINVVGNSGANNLHINDVSIEKV